MKREREREREAIIGDTVVFSYGKRENNEETEREREIPRYSIYHLPVSRMFHC